MDPSGGFSPRTAGNYLHGGKKDKTNKKTGHSDLYKSLNFISLIPNNEENDSDVQLQVPIA